jgi:hypothetical protein
MKIADTVNDTRTQRGDRMHPAAAAPASGPPRAAYLSLTSRPGAGATVPIFYSSNRVGDALLSTVGRVAGSAMAAMSPILPVGLAGLEIHEALHRFDANLHLPTRERGLSSANHVGEPLAMLSMRWRLVPDGFAATPTALVPDTEIATGSSQRFVMQEGTITLRDRSEGTIRFFGAGRTYPATTDGSARLLFAGTAVVVEGTGSLKGTRGTLLISGEVTPPATVSLTVVGRFDAGSPVAVEDMLGPLIDLTGRDAPATVLTVVGDTGVDGVERIRVARIGNDLPNASGLRSLLRLGLRVGTVSGALLFDAADLRCAVELTGASRVVTFTDPAGVRIGSITAPYLEGTAFPEQLDGHAITRLAAYGAASHGTGALTGAGGVLTMDATVDAAGAATTLYTLRIADPAGRFRASYADVHKPMPAATPAASPMPAGAEALNFVAGAAGQMSATDREILRYAERTLADGMELAQWWEEKDRASAYAETFDVVREYNDSGRSFGFFDTAAVANAGLPVMGIVQEMFYDRQKMATGEVVRDQLKEFVLKYFLRVSHLRQPGAAVAGDGAPLTSFQRAFSWLPDDGERRVGFGYQQLYYKRRDSAAIGKFIGDEQSAIVDLRDIGTVYDWILLKVNIFDFNLSFAPFGAEAPKLQMPLKESTYLVLGAPFIKNQDNPEPGVLGRYGFGYAFVPYAPGGAGVIAYGPGHFAAAIQNVDFTVMADGEIRVRAAFVVNRPNKIAQVDIDPIGWGFKLADMMTFGTASRVMSPIKEIAETLPLRVSGLDPISTYIWMANTMTNGMAGRRLGHSKTVLEKRMLVQHFMQHYEMLTSSLLVWRMVPDWTDPECLPAFCREGVEC